MSAIQERQQTEDVAPVFVAGELAAGDGHPEPARDAALKALTTLSDDRLGTLIHQLVTAYDNGDGDRLVDAGLEAQALGKRARRDDLHGGEA